MYTEKISQQQYKYSHAGLKLSGEEKLEILNQAYDNARSEGFDVTAEDNEKLAEWNAIFKYKNNPGNRGDERNNNGIKLPENIRFRRIPEMNECPFCHKFYPHKKRFLHPHIKKCHPAEWPNYWQQNRQRNGTRLDELEQYKEHFRVDDTGNSYVCNFCDHNFELGKTAKFINHLRRTHLGFKDFVCDYEGCGAEYTNHWNLKNHKMLVHEKIKPFACNCCDSKFVTKAKLMEHMKSMHIEEWYLERERMKTVRAQNKAETKRRKQAEDDAKAEARAKKRREKLSDMPDCVRDEAFTNFIIASKNK